MNNNLDLNKLRGLLHKYYEAETSPDEENFIISIFSEIEAETTPEYMTADREFFLSIKELLPCPTDLESPADLLGKINREISVASGIVLKDTKKKWERHFYYAVSAAVACVLLSFGMWHIYTSHFLKSSTVDNLVENPSATIEEYHSIISEPIETKTISETSMQKPSACPPARQSHHIIAEDVALHQDDNKYIEITDPEEAREIILEIGKLLANNSRKTKEATRIVEEAVDEYKEITKQLLK